MVGKSHPLRLHITPVLLVTFCLTGAAALLFREAAPEGALRLHILSQIYAVCVLFALASLFLFLDIPAARVSVFFLKLLCVFFVTRAAGTEILPLISLLFAFSFEVFFFSGVRVSLAFTLTLLGILFFSEADNTSWNIPRADLTAEKSAVLLLVIAAASIAGAMASLALHAGISREKEIRRLEEAVDNLTRTNAAYQTYATYIEETSKEDERHRISREMHDIVGYSMTNLLMMVQAALYSENQDQITELLQKAQTHINDSLLEIRMALRKLRSIQKKTLHGSELICYVTANFQKVTGIKITLDFISFPARINPDIEEILYRLLQEAMTNSFRHGRASEIEISFWTTDGVLTVKIRDNGRPHDEAQITEGIGFQGMRERISGAGGSVTMNAVKDGFTVLAHLPLEKRTEP